MPIVFESEEALLNVKNKLEDLDIYPRRYFYPSLDIAYSSIEFSEKSISLSERILCLPLYNKLTCSDIEKVKSVLL